MDKVTKILVIILIISAVLRILNINHGDPRGDEVFYAFRAVGMLDFDEAEFQTTPLEWFDPDIPWWASLSFHDHPPFVFLVQNISMHIFGENNFGFRFPSAIFGLLSVYFVYLIGGQLFSASAGLIGAAFLGFTVNHIFVSRVGLQESYVIFFLLLSIYLFLKGLKKDKYFIWTGVALGFAFLTKYTTFVLLPVFFTYFLFYKRNLFLNKYLWLGGLLALLIFSPVLVYNAMLYKSVGHFDFQLSYIFGQNPEVWQNAPGKEEIGSITDRIYNFIPTLIISNSWILLLFFTLSLVVIWKSVFLLTIIIWLCILYLFIGPTLRFLTMLTPFIALSIANMFQVLKEQETKKLLIGLLIFILFFELLYSINSQIIDYPVGSEILAFSKVRYENYNWGYNKLGDYFKKELKQKMPALAFEMQYKFLDNLQQKALERARRKNYELYPALIIYDGNVANIPQLWFLDRLEFYHGWPVLRAEDYFSLRQKNGYNYFDAAGIKNYYFVMPAEKLPLDSSEKLTGFGADLEQELKFKKIEPEILKNSRGDEVFRIYKF